MRRKEQLPRAILQTYFRSPSSHKMDCILWELFLYLDYEKSLDYSDRAIQSQVRLTSPYVSPLQAQVTFDWAGHAEQDTENVSWAAIENGQLWKGNRKRNQIFSFILLWAVLRLEALMQQTHRHILPLKCRQERTHSLGNPNGSLLINKNTENSTIRNGREHKNLHSPFSYT